MAKSMKKKPAAKSSSKKPPLKKSAKASAKKPASKPSSKSASKPKAAAAMENPSRVTTGKGPGPESIGRDLVSMFNRGLFKEIEDKFWSPSIVSVEGIGMAWHGRKAVEAKNNGWMEQNEIQGAAAEGPFVGASGFAVKFRMDVVERASGKRTVMDEVGVYTVQDGKIVREEFMYGSAKG